VAAGHFDVYWRFGPGLPSLAPGVPLATDVGAIATELHGAPWQTDSGDIVIAAPDLHPPPSNPFPRSRRATKRTGQDDDTNRCAGHRPGGYTGLGSKLSTIGHDVTFGTLDPKTAAGRWTEPPVRFASTTDAVRDAAVVINTTPGAATLELLTPLREALAGRVLVDVANATEHEPGGGPIRLLYPGSSLAEHLQDALPDTDVVQDSQHDAVPVDDRSGGRRHGEPAHGLHSGNNDAAKTVTRGLPIELGRQDGWIEDLGDITSAPGPEAFMLYVSFLARKYGMVPFGLSLAVPR
jgi:predicted dinucleotide-binding enzyme